MFYRNREHNQSTWKGRREVKVTPKPKETNTETQNKAWQSLVQKTYMFVLLTADLHLC